MGTLKLLGAPYKRSLCGVVRCSPHSRPTPGLEWATLKFLGTSYKRSLCGEIRPSRDSLVGPLVPHLRTIQNIEYKHAYNRVDHRFDDLVQPVRLHS